MLKRTFVLSAWLFALLIMGWNAYGSNVSINIKTPPPTDTGTRSIIRTPFIPMGNSGSLDILCLADMGTVTVEVLDELGNAVYVSSVLAATNSIWSILVDGWILGSYTLSITRANGMAYLWEFELEEE